MSTEYLSYENFNFEVKKGVPCSLTSSHKAYDKLITMTEKKGGVLVLFGELEPFFNWQSSKSRQIRQVFNVHVHERVLNDAINYAPKGCTMQLWGITLNEGKCRETWYNGINLG